MKHRPDENNNKVNFAHVVTQTTMCSEGTEHDDNDVLAQTTQSHPKIALEKELSLWLKDQRQRTVKQANVNYVSNAELQKARNMMAIMFVNRRSKITSKTTLNSRATYYWQVQ